MAAQKDAYAKELETQLKQGVEQLGKEHSQKTEQLHQNSNEQRNQYHAMLEKQVKEQEIILNRQYNQQLTVLQNAAQQQLAELEQQASLLLKAWHQQQGNEDGGSTSSGSQPGSPVSASAPALEQPIFDARPLPMPMLPAQLGQQTLHGGQLSSSQPRHSAVAGGSMLLAVPGGSVAVRPGSFSLSVPPGSMRVAPRSVSMRPAARYDVPTALADAGRSKSHGRLQLPTSASFQHLALVAPGGIATGGSVNVATYPLRPLTRTNSEASAGIPAGYHVPPPEGGAYAFAAAQAANIVASHGAASHVPPVVFSQDAAVSEQVRFPRSASLFTGYHSPPVEARSVAAISFAPPQASGTRHIAYVPPG